MEKNYITPAGLKILQDELRFLKYDERPKVTEVVSWAAGNGDRSENGDYIYGKRRLREIDSRIRFLSKRIENAEVIEPEKIEAQDVRFGATVTIHDEEGNEKKYCIVGEDEANAAKGRLNWKSPVATALLRKKVGDWVTVRSPKGNQELEIVDIQYKAIAID
jgi:transcription elongation factor GreB